MDMDPVTALMLEGAQGQGVGHRKTIKRRPWPRMVEGAV